MLNQVANWREGVVEEGEAEVRKREGAIGHESSMP